jgi:hypothetical protein
LLECSEKTTARRVMSDRGSMKQKIMLAIQTVMLVVLLLVLLSIGLIIFFKIMEYHASVARSLNVTPVLNGTAVQLSVKSLDLWQKIAILICTNVLGIYGLYKAFDLGALQGTLLFHVSGISLVMSEVLLAVMCKDALWFLLLYNAVVICSLLIYVYWRWKIDYD